MCPRIIDHSYQNNRGTHNVVLLFINKPGMRFYLEGLVFNYPV
nr:MAG TPA: hypothetical protein [Caudoviricetes sp.]